MPVLDLLAAPATTQVVVLAAGYELGVGRAVPTAAAVLGLISAVAGGAGPGPIPPARHRTSPDDRGRGAGAAQRDRRWSTRGQRRRGPRHRQRARRRRRRRGAGTDRHGPRRARSGSRSSPLRTWLRSRARVVSARPVRRRGVLRSDPAPPPTGSPPSALAAHPSDCRPAAHAVGHADRRRPRGVTSPCRRVRWGLVARRRRPPGVFPVVSGGTGLGVVTLD